jgi:DNA-binding response OmpR family regulator
MKILIVEDDSDIAALMEWTVHEYSPQAEVIVAMTNERALEELRPGTDISLVFADLIGCNGCTVIKESLALGIRVVACTGKLLEGPEDICFVELLQKPFELAELKRFLS